MDMIKSAKEDELKEEAMKADMAQEMDDMVSNTMFLSSRKKMCAAVPQQMMARRSMMSLEAESSSEEEEVEDDDNYEECEVNGRSLEAQSQETQEYKGGKSSSS